LFSAEGNYSLNNDNQDGLKAPPVTLNMTEWLGLRPIWLAPAAGLRDGGSGHYTYRS